MSRNRKSSKTAHVLKLLTNSSDNVNPMINDGFKEEVIHSRIQPKAANEQNDDPKPVAVNVISELVYEIMPEVLSRFNCCTCDVCQAEISIKVMDELGTHYTPIIDENSYRQLNQIKDEKRKIVTRKLVSIAFKYRNMTKHI
ncbi:MAG: hypothetical protein GX967_06610 [Clostridiales bacterium]|nr:hypothetical protein [Clostridiales bacterium]